MLNRIIIYLRIQITKPTFLAREPSHLLNNTLSRCCHLHNPSLVINFSRLVIGERVSKDNRNRLTVSSQVLPIALYGVAV